MPAILSRSTTAPTRRLPPSKRRSARRGEAATLLQLGVACQNRACLLWPFGTTTKGYPVIRLSEPRRMALAHREVCRRVHGEPPHPDSESAHSCGQRSCINGCHLRWATAVENAADKVAHGTSLDGEKNHRAVLTLAQVRRVRKSPRSGAALARDLKCSPSTIYAIRRNVNWRRL